MRLLVIIALLIPSLQGCLFVGSRQEISQDPVRFIDSTTKAELPDVLILPRYTVGEKLIVARAFVYRMGDQLRIEPPTSSGIIIGTAFAGEHRSLDGFVVFAKGYKPRWGGMGTREYFDDTKHRTVEVREVLMAPAADMNASWIPWIQSQVGNEKIDVTKENMAMFDLGAVFPVFNEIDQDGKSLVKRWAEEKAPWKGP